MFKPVNGRKKSLEKPWVGLDSFDFVTTIKLENTDNTTNPNLRSTGVFPGFNTHVIHYFVIKNQCKASSSH